MSDPASRTKSALDVLAADVREERRIALHALHVLEYTLTAPAPRRHRTWLHRVTVAVDALHTALRAQLHADDQPMCLLDEIAPDDVSVVVVDRWCSGVRPAAT